MTASSMIMCDVLADVLVKGLFSPNSQVHADSPALEPICAILVRQNASNESRTAFQCLLLCRLLL